MTTHRTKQAMLDVELAWWTSSNESFDAAVAAAQRPSPEDRPIASPQEYAWSRRAPPTDRKRV
jgi:hypothetical protein